MKKCTEVTWPITLEELLELRKKEKDPKIRFRLQMIILVKKGLGITKVAEILGTYHSHVRYWLDRFNSGGPEALKTRKPPGAKPRADYDKIRKALRKSPREFGYPVDAWTVKILHAYIRDHLGVNYHPNYIYELVHKLGFSLIKPRTRDVRSPGGDAEETFKKRSENS